MRWSFGAAGRELRRAQRRGKVFFWPTRTLILRLSKDVLPPEFEGRAARQPVADRRQLGGQTFLKPSKAAGSWASWRGRADSLRKPSVLTVRPTELSSRLIPKRA